MKFIHSADWQLGARFAQFSDRAVELRQVRLDTLERVLKMASERGADAFLIAGDLFEDNQVESTLVEKVVDLFTAYSEVPILILPGNHDPYTGPNSVWDRRCFSGLGDHVTVFRETESKRIAEGYFLASPLRQKVSSRDPSMCLGALTESLPKESIRVGITHGALAIPGKHQPNDFPIALDAATRLGLDYLAIGHWHRWQTYDEDRIVMPGTPEPDSFGAEEKGRVAWVEISEPGAIPKVEPLAVNSLSWQTVDYDLERTSLSRQQITQRIAGLEVALEKCVFRVVLSGQTTEPEKSQAEVWLQEQFQNTFLIQLHDKSRLTLSESERVALAGEHPILASVIDDLLGIQTQIGDGSGDANEIPRFPLNELARLLEDSKIPLSELDARHLEQSRSLLLGMLQEAKQ